MPTNSSQATDFNHLKGWIFDAYPTGQGEMAVWIITEMGQRIRLTDRFHPKIYVSDAQGEIEHLPSKLCFNPDIAAWTFSYKYAQPNDSEKSKVLELTLKDCRRTHALTTDILRMGDYLRYGVHNCDLKGDRAYFFCHDIFPLAAIEVKTEKTQLHYTLLDSVESTNYIVPEMRVLKLNVEIAPRGKIPNFQDPIAAIRAIQNCKEICIDSGDESEKLLQIVNAVKAFDPDIILTSGGDSYLFHYMSQRATVNGVQNQFILSRDHTPIAPKMSSGKTLFSYGRTFYRAGPIRLYGRIHIDTTNTFILSEAGLDGLIEIARTCRVPLHTAARNSIGSSMSSLQFYQAIKDDMLIPRNKSIPEAFKTANELLVGDRGGFVFEPRVGAHDHVGEVDFSSLYPSLMANNNISVETVLCKCCPDSPLRIPELNYNICIKREGIVPKTLHFVIKKRLTYKNMAKETSDPHLKEVYGKRQMALKWILVTCFGYLGYKNAKFGTVDGHMGICAFGREALLNASHTAEEHGFEVIHGIVDSLWLKKPDAAPEDYHSLCEIISAQSKVPINFEGKYKWICFLPSKIHPRIGVLNRYFGVMEDGKIKVRGLEVRRRDTPRFVFYAQTEMIKALSLANNSAELQKAIPQAIEVVQKYRSKLLDGNVSIQDLIVTKHMSKKPTQYRQQVSQVIAAEQLIKEGAQVHAGKNVKFLFTHSENKRPERRVQAQQLIEKGVPPDTKKYLMLLYSSAANLLSFADYTPKTICDTLKGQNRANLANWISKG